MTLKNKKHWIGLGLFLFQVTLLAIVAHPIALFVPLPYAVPAALGMGLIIGALTNLKTD